MFHRMTRPLTAMTLMTLSPLSANATSLCSAPPRDMADTSTPLITDFSRKIDPCDWEIVTSNWGGRTDEGDYSGGVISENVAEGDGNLVLTANGNFYDGPLRGRGSDGALRPDGKRTGAAIRSKRKFLGGRFEACVTVPPVLGVVTAFWTFRYEEVADAPPRNHEIDIEFPGQRDAVTPVDLDHVNFTTWTSLDSNGHTTAFKPLSSRTSDGKFHLLRFDWMPRGSSTDGQVDFYIDNQHLATIDKTVPYLPGEVWFGLWFPPLWAGTPDFDRAEMRVKWVRAGGALQAGTAIKNDLVCE